ncbi:hypothetical protein FA13DRAFT_1751836 [Coprinellus micaceus]|uniref:DUF6589 domain-containing protein n=1 Tax=Coprinellus micaceus TaxID=71717 RepID=A0A4Y7TVV1_COPMI|nr:hypothetical protein FA13DRAFT_1751836 [Coprinellus micaceus]
MAKRTSKARGKAATRGAQGTSATVEAGGSTVNQGEARGELGVQTELVGVERGTQTGDLNVGVVDAGTQTKEGGMVESGVQAGVDTTEIGVQAGASFIHHKRAPKRPLAEKVADILPAFKEANISPFDLVVALLDETREEFRAYRTAIYKPSNKKIHSILDTISSSTQGGSEKMTSWMKGEKGASFVSGIVGKEMDEIKPSYTLKGLKDVTPEYIQDADIDNFVKKAPFTVTIVRAAAQTARQAAENTVKSPDLLCNIMMLQLLYQRSNNCLGFAAQFGLFLWATGASRAAIEAAHALGLSVRYQSVLNHLAFLAATCMERTVVVAMGFYMFCYDNINLSTSIHVEQRGSGATPGKVTSGTLGIVYPLPDTINPEDMELQPILKRMRDCPGLNFDKHLRAISHQFLVHLPRRPLPEGHKTEFMPGRVSTTEEASVGGNLQFQKESHIDMLKGDVERLSKYAIPSINDQLTNSHIRSGQIIQASDVNDFERRLMYQLAMGLFHAALNLAWALLQVHKETMHSVGSLAFWIIILEKACLSGPKPDYHTLYATLEQVLEGLLLSAWMEVCTQEDPDLDDKAKKSAGISQKKKSLRKYASSKPTPADLEAKAQTILNDFVAPLPELYSEADDSDSDTENGQTGSIKTSASLCEMSSTSLSLSQQSGMGTLACIEDILPHLAMIYRGAGSNNYAAECLYLVQNLKIIWPINFANIMRDLMIVNPSGIPGHCIATDINMEYTIREIKELIVAKGCENTWDHVGDIAAAIQSLKEIKRKMAKNLKLPHQNKGHSDVDISRLVWRVAERAEKDKLLGYTCNRQGNAKVKVRKDLLDLGAQRLQSASLTTFNLEDEEDELPEMGLEKFPEEEEDGSSSESEGGQSERGSDMEIDE